MAKTATKVKDKKAAVSSKKSEKLKVKTKASKTKEKKTTKRTRKEKEVVQVSPIKEKLNASKLIEHLVSETGLEKKQVKSVMQALHNTIVGSVHKKGIGEFTFPKLFKVITKHVPAKKARKGISPFSGEEVIFKAKPATTKVKIRPMKTLKESAL